MTSAESWKSWTRGVNNLGYPSGPTLDFSYSDRALQAKLREVALTEDDTTAVASCIAELEDLSSKIGPEWRVRPFGGMSNGFGMHGSDLDATCYNPSEEDKHASTAFHELLTNFMPLIRTHPKLEITEEIWGARVPLVKLRYDGVLDVDLTCHNTQPIKNTQLLCTYASLSPVVRDLGLLVKLWAKSVGVCGAARGYLSSYSLTLMVIFFLQTCPDVQVPVLPVWAFTGEGETPEAARVIASLWTCTESITKLLVNFFLFYSLTFQWTVEVVSVRLGVRCNATDTRFSELRFREFPRLHIEDPFILDRNLNCVLGEEQEQEFYLKLCETAHGLRFGRIPPALMCETMIDLEQTRSFPADVDVAVSDCSPPGSDRQVKGLKSAKSLKNSKILVGKNGMAPMTLGVAGEHNVKEMGIEVAPHLQAQMSPGNNVRHAPQTKMGNAEYRDLMHRKNVRGLEPALQASVQQVTPAEAKASRRNVPEVLAALPMHNSNAKPTLRQIAGTESLGYRNSPLPDQVPPTLLQKSWRL